jgi:hypothetical protein
LVALSFFVRGSKRVHRPTAGPPNPAFPSPTTGTAMLAGLLRGRETAARRPAI